MPLSTFVIILVFASCVFFTTGFFLGHYVAKKYSKRIAIEKEDAYLEGIAEGISQEVARKGRCKEP